MSKSTKGNNQHVVPHPDGWAVKSEGATKATRVTDTQKEAIEIAREIARNQGSDLIFTARIVRFARRIAMGTIRTLLRVNSH